MGEVVALAPAGRRQHLLLGGVLYVSAHIGAGMKARQVEEVLLHHARAAGVLHDGCSCGSNRDSPKRAGAGGAYIRWRCICDPMERSTRSKLAQAPQRFNRVLSGGRLSLTVAREV